MGDNQTLLWIVLAVVVVVVLVGLLVWFARSGRRDDLRRREAQRLREKADAERLDLQAREAEAARLDAQARLAQAEADTRAAEAARLQAEARAHADDLEAPRTRVDERLRRADALDPDVDTSAGAPATAGTVGTTGAAGTAGAPGTTGTTGLGTGTTPAPRHSAGPADDVPGDGR